MLKKCLVTIFSLALLNADDATCNILVDISLYLLIKKLYFSSFKLWQRNSTELKYS